MPSLIKLRWDPACDYTAYVPDRLGQNDLRLDASTAADVTDAELAIARLNDQTSTLGNSEALARLLLRAEAVASSKIEGLEVGGRRLLKAQLARDLPDGRSDITAAEVLNNIEAMNWAVETLSTRAPITVAGLLDVHERLLAGTRLEEQGGKVREVQNWIGGSDYNPCSAAFVPPPPDRVRGLLQDLCEFCNSDLLPAVAQAAIAHAQFETIHPFIDGNGRTGRALIHVILRRRGIAPRFVPPISLVLATHAAAYVEGLNRTRYDGTPDSQEAMGAMNAWIAFFAGACRRAVSDAEAFDRRVAELQDEWRARLGRVRKNSAMDRLLDAIPGAPMITVQSGAALVSRSAQAVNEAIPRLVDAGVLNQTTIGKRNRAFEAAELIDSFTALERQLASPAADTRTSRPIRRVPHRRSK